MFYIQITRRNQSQVIQSDRVVGLPKVSIMREEYRLPDFVSKLFLEDISGKEFVYHPPPEFPHPEMGGFSSGGELIFIDGDKWKWSKEYLYECKTKRIWHAVRSSRYYSALGDAMHKAISKDRDVDLGNSEIMVKLIESVNSEIKTELEATGP